jgi:hypothetical protein
MPLSPLPLRVRTRRLAEPFLLRCCLTVAVCWVLAVVETSTCHLRIPATFSLASRACIRRLRVKTELAARDRGYLPVTRAVYRFTGHGVLLWPLL